MGDLHRGRRGLRGAQHLGERAGRRALTARDGFAWFEWSAPPGLERSDPEGWRWANPALGRLITMETIASEAKHDPPEVFETEVLCRRVATLAAVVASGDLGRHQRPGHGSRWRPGGVQFGRRSRAAPRFHRGGVAAPRQPGARGGGRRLRPGARPGAGPCRGAVGGAGGAVEAVRGGGRGAVAVGRRRQRALEDWRSRSSG